MSYDYPIYYIRWVDAVADRHDENAKDDLAPQTIHSVGWLLKKCKTHVTITEEYGADDWVRGRTTIPKKMIVEMVKIL